MIRTNLLFFIDSLQLGVSRQTHLYTSFPDESRFANDSLFFMLALPNHNMLLTSITNQFYVMCGWRERERERFVLKIFQRLTRRGFASLVFYIADRKLVTLKNIINCDGSQLTLPMILFIHP